MTLDSVPRLPTESPLALPPPPEAGLKLPLPAPPVEPSPAMSPTIIAAALPLGPFGMLRPRPPSHVQHDAPQAERWISLASPRPQLAAYCASKGTTLR